MQTSNAYADLYEGNQKTVSDLIGGYNPSELEKQMLEKSNYNKPLIDEIARSNEKVNQINASYDWAENPALAGMGMGDRARLKALDAGGAKQEGAVAGMMYTARQDDLAGAITAWKDAFDAKYGAAKELSTGYSNLQGMAFGSERATAEDAQWQKDFDQKMAIAQMQEAGANARATTGKEAGTPWTSAMANDVEGMKQVLGKNGTGQYAREQIINTMQAKYGGDPLRNQQISDMVYGAGEYQGAGLAPDNWEKAYYNSDPLGLGL